MSLSVDVYKKNLDTGQLELLKYELGEQLAGSEANRVTLWGSKIVQSLGLTILPSLQHKDIDVHGDQLEILEQEVHLLLKNINLVVGNTPTSDVTIRNLCNNILKAIQKAKSIGGGVKIW